MAHLLHWTKEDKYRNSFYYNFFFKFLKLSSTISLASPNPDLILFNFKDINMFAIPRNNNAKANVNTK